MGETTKLRSLVRRDLFHIESFKQQHRIGATKLERPVSLCDLASCPTCRPLFSAVSRLLKALVNIKGRQVSCHHSDHTHGASCEKCDALSLASSLARKSKTTFASRGLVSCETFDILSSVVALLEEVALPRDDEWQPARGPNPSCLPPCQTCRRLPLADSFVGDVWDKLKHPPGKPSSTSARKFRALQTGVFQVCDLAACCTCLLEPPQTKTGSRSGISSWKSSIFAVVLTMKALPTTNVVFQHPRMADAEKQIRLLRFDGMSMSTKIPRFTMTVHDLEEHGTRYTAVSYTWGDPEPTDMIMINGDYMRVRRNCYNALWQVTRHFDPARLFWIDAVCIDQLHHGEKNTQVAQMGTIFAEAYNVAACVGGFEDDVDSTVMKPLDATASPQSILFLAQRPYFKRLWTVQECILARQIDVFWADQSAAWERLLQRCQGFQESMYHHQDFVNLMQFYQDTLDYKPLASSSGKWLRMKFYDPTSDFTDVTLVLSGMIVRYCDRQCCEPRDKIYGLLSFTSSDIRRRFPTDYNKPLLEVMQDYLGIHDELVLERKSRLGNIRRKVAVPLFGGAVIQVKVEVTQLFESLTRLVEAFSQDAQFVRDFRAYTAESESAGAFRNALSNKSMDGGRQKLLIEGRNISIYTINEGDVQDLGLGARTSSQAPEIGKKQETFFKPGAREDEPQVFSERVTSIDLYYPPGTPAAVVLEREPPYVRASVQEGDVLVPIPIRPGSHIFLFCRPDRDRSPRYEAVGVTRHSYRLPGQTPRSSHPEQITIAISPRNLLLVAMSWNRNQPGAFGLN